MKGALVRDTQADTCVVGEVSGPVVPETGAVWRILEKQRFEPVVPLASDLYQHRVFAFIAYRNE